LLHIAGRNGSKEIAMILLSILWRKSILFSGYPDFMHVNEKGEDAAEVTSDPSLSSLIRACIDRYSVVNVNNLREEDTLESEDRMKE
jgi:singapore isolate B (sub-type 7) whole genome shotgun sequence assembly, scaffold_24